VLAGIALLVRLSSPGPTIFRQQRVGFEGRTFEMLKFRTMRLSDEVEDSRLRLQIERELAGVQEPVNGSFKLPDDPRVTRVGRVLRTLSLDELPQLVNVVRGEMSIVGPRPALAWEHELFPEEHRCRVAVPPGMTGLWQVSGRSALDTRAMLELDSAYVRSHSPMTDLRIMWATIAVLRRDRSAR
jgi:lipopolysaccharide/colanic/teichoic acid biosynthesis glycosyltransferase